MPLVTLGASEEPADPPVFVLIVDDNAAKRLALKAVLLPLGHQIVEADSGVAALRCVMVQDFAVILLDVCMPIMDGFETAAIIRRRRQSEMTPIIFITAYGRDEVVSTDHFAEGAVDFIFAPVPPAELRAKVTVFANLFLKAETLAVRARHVQASADQLTLLTDAAPIGIFQTDADNRYVYTNPRWSELTGISAADAVGREWDTVMDAEQRGQLRAESGEPGPRAELGHRFEIRSSVAASRVVVVTSRVMLAPDGEVAGWVGTLADVTAEAGAETAMTQARDAATEASRLKSDFLANMSHEIRTPMNGVIGMTDLLLETDLDARQRDYAQTVRNSGEDLLTIINNILDFSKVEVGKVEIEDIDFDVRDVVHGVVDLLGRPADAKGLALEADISASVAPAVSGDPGRVRQVLTNLVGNAIKFTRTGSVAVRVSQVDAADPSADTVVRFEVVDTGDGIAGDKLDAIFAPFVQADSSTSREYGGTGLGLSISRQLVALMGGDCGVTSRLGEGSTFWFTVTVHAASGARQLLRGPAPDLAGTCVLVVADDVTLRSRIDDIVSDWGMFVTSTPSGHAALAAMRAAVIRGRPFALALVDRPVPGADDLVGRTLTTPVDLGDLLADVRAALGLADSPTLDGEVFPPPSSTGAPRAGRLLLAEDNLVNQKVAVAMLSDAGYVVDTVLDGAAAVLAASSRTYDAILMDCQMPTLNGYEATVAIRAQEGSGRRTPIIALTAGARKEDRERAVAAGMDGYLSKPVGKDSLLALVGRSVRAASAAEARPADHVVAAEITVDPAVLAELLDLGSTAEPSFLTGIVEQFLRETEPRLDELRTAVGLGDALSVVRIAHSIKGSCAQLGGRRLAMSCARLEREATSGALSDRPSDLQEVELDYRELRRTLLQLSSELRRDPRGMGA